MLWTVSILLMAFLWVSGMRLFLRSGLTRRRKVVWTLFLAATGALIGWLLPLDAIRNRFLIVLAVLPILAFADVRLARSNRSFAFWLRACSFEVCTVFGVAAITRLLVTRA